MSITIWTDEEIRLMRQAAREKGEYEARYHIPDDHPECDARREHLAAQVAENEFRIMAYPNPYPLRPIEPESNT